VINVDDITALGFALVALGAITLVLLRYRTVLLGFSFFAFFTIASTSLSGFLFDWLFNLQGYWITDAHLRVVINSSLGLIAFSLGLALAWRPLIRHRAIAAEASAGSARGSETIAGRKLVRGESADLVPVSALERLPWFNPQFALLCLALAIATYLLTPIFYRIATVRAIWSTFYDFLPIAMLLSLVYGLTTRCYRPFAISVLVFVPLVLSAAVTSGHIGAGGGFLVHLLIVACFWTGLKPRSLIFFCIGMAMLGSLIFGWMHSRDVIRSGQLVEFETNERVAVFLGEFEYVNPLSLSPVEMQQVIRLRVDMTDILAAQVQYQPLFQPYAYGGTIFASLIEALVPRFLWPDKPVRLGGSSFVSQYTGIDFGDNISVGLPYQFELYANGGVSVVIGGLFVIGWLIGWLELALFSPNNTMPRMLVLLFLASAISGGAQTIVALIMSLLAGVAGYYAIGKIIEMFNLTNYFWHTSSHDGLAQNTFPAKTPLRRAMDAARK
jgi:hypothetical protein